MIERLDRTVPPPPGKPRRPGAEETQTLALRTALAPGSWLPEEAARMASSFDEMSALWDTERGAYRPVPLADALNRGGPFPEGLCVEVGCGTGLLTPLAEQLWEPVVGIELSAGMLARGRSATRLRADASFLPLRSGVAACVLIADSLLFAGEVGRVLGESGVVVWSNALGREAPYHVPSETLLDVLTEAAGGRWRAVESEAGWGSWAVFHRLPSE